MSGIKFDKDKLPMYLVDPYAHEEMVKVLQFGMNKYTADNWKKGLNYNQLIGALERHLSEIKKGIDNDDESGLLHAGHLACCAHFLTWMTLFRKDLDNRYWTLQSINTQEE